MDPWAVRYNAAAGELLDAEPLRAEAGLIVEDLVVGLLDVVLEVGPREAERPEELAESEIASSLAIRILEVILEALAVRGKALAELGELVGLGGIHLDIECGRPEKRLGGCEEARAVRHFVQNKRYDQLFVGTDQMAGILFNFFLALTDGLRSGGAAKKKTKKRLRLNMR